MVFFVGQLGATPNRVQQPILERVSRYGNRVPLFQ